MIWPFKKLRRSRKVNTPEPVNVRLWTSLGEMGHVALPGPNGWVLYPNNWVEPGKVLFLNPS